VYGKYLRRFAAPVTAGLVTSAVVAGLAVGAGGGQPGPPASTGQVAGFLQIGPGPAVPVLSFSWGASSPTTIGSPGGGAGAGKASFSSLNIMRGADAKSAELLQNLAQGKHYPSATLTIESGAGPTASKAVYKLEQVFVEALQQSGAGDGVTESLSLVYAKIRWEFTDAAGNTQDGSWDLVANSK
jgi:type VI secretion system secreted protein Hcp